MRTDHTPKAHTSLAYNPDVAGAADAVAQLLDDPNLTPRPDPNLAANHLRLILGIDFTTPDDITTSPDADTTTESPSAGVPATSLRTDGIPCVK